jgi:molybdopterin-guanine dinucleotide biosynthesis protein A
VRTPAAPATGPLPGAYRWSALTVLEWRVREGRLALHQALAELVVRQIAVYPAELVNVNTPDDLEAARPELREAPS